MQIEVSTQSLVLCLSEAIDLISPSLSHHHRLVTGVAWQFCNELGLPQADKREILYACALHDVGALSEDELHQIVDGIYESADEHAQRGALFFRELPPFSKIAEYIRQHHTHWDPAAKFDFNENPNKIAANIIYLCDRIAVSIRIDQNILSQSSAIIQMILNMGEKYFAHDLLEVFQRLAEKEVFWLNIVSYSLKDIFNANISPEYDDKIDNYQLIKIFSRIIDFRSPFTATHSSGVAATSRALAEVAGFSEDDQGKMEIAGFVHDLGKLAVPTGILEKNGPLNPEEFRYIRTHTYYTHYILSAIENFDDIRQWASQHHERLDGSGYPFHLKGNELSKGARIMAVADVFVALLEPRPYRASMEKIPALNIIQSMADKALDRAIIQLLIENFEYINLCRIQAQSVAAQEYRAFQEKAVRVG